MKTLAILNGVAILIILLFVAVDLSDLIQYVLQPGEYRFGTEVAGFRYASSTHFIASATTTLVIALVALAAPLFCKPEWLYLGIRMVTALGLCIVAVYSAK